MTVSLSHANRTPIIVDCDPGVDDAITLLLAFGLNMPIAAITTVAGNVPLSLTYSNARKICALANRTDIPVHAGCPRPIIRPLATAEEVHGATGLQGADLPEPTTSQKTQHSVAVLTETLLNADEPIVIAALGPLTNIAIALIQTPRIAKHIKQLVIMGGSMGQGNITPAAEFNMYVDPHAAHIVLSAGIPTTLITLDTTHQVLTTPERLKAIRAIGNPVSTAAAGMLAFYGQSDVARYGLPGGPLHDPCVMAYLHSPGLFTTRPVNITIETIGEHTLGQTVIDRHPESPSTIEIVDTVDVEGFYQLLNRALSQF